LLVVVESLVLGLVILAGILDDFFSIRRPTIDFFDVVLIVLMDNFFFAGLTVNVFEFFDKVGVGVGVMRSREITGYTVANGILVDKLVVDDYLLRSLEKI
jgi:hypothetical protein